MTDTYIAEVVRAAKDGAQYDDAVKEILSDKNILAWILLCTAKEFQSMSIQEIMECIEDEPEISKVPIEPGRTNEAITGDDTEDEKQHEGYVRFDIRFHVILRHKRKLKIIVNIEAQKKFHTGYNLVTRGIYYGARLISSQKNREFSGSYYDDIKKVYSIWICLDAPLYAQNTITEYKIHQDKLYGDYKGKARYDLMSIIMICLGTPKDFAGLSISHQKLLRLLTVLASHRLAPEEKLHILEQEYHIATTRKLEKGVNSMCNWSEGIIERITEEVTREVTERITEEVSARVTRATKAEAIRNIMDELKVSLEEACRILKVNSAEYTFIG